jgi:toxin HigB-1
MPRPISIVHVTPDFEKAFLRLPKHIQTLATRKDQWFRKHAFDPRLRTHKLKGELSAYWAYSVNREYRVLFRFLTPTNTTHEHDPDPYRSAFILFPLYPPKLSR